MYSENGTVVPAPICADGNGSLPSCAPLAVPYVPYQQAGSKRYERNDALNNGTLFPGLNLPFHINAVAADVVNTPMAELQALDFVCHELALYLDTHKEDAEAYELFRQYVAMHEEGRRRYEKRHGPLTRNAAVMGNTYEWTRDPWPWDPPGGAK